MTELRGAGVRALLRRICFAAAVSVLACPLTHAEQTSLPPAVQACMRILPDKERLECFDRETAALLHDRPLAAPSAGAVSPAPGGEVPRRRQLTEEEALGLSVRARSKLEGESDTQATKVTRLQAHATSVSGAASGRYVIALDNGQVWRQIEPRPTFTLRPGDAVTVSQGTLGSFWISTGPHNSTKVERVR